MNTPRRRNIIFITGLLLSLRTAVAHCPLCTVGAAAAAGGAAMLGVSNAAIGIFIGAFAVSMGWWFSRFLKKRYIPLQKSALITISFLTTVLPIMPLLSDVRPLYISWLGPYGTTLAINLFLPGALLGGLIVSITPALSKKITSLRQGQIFPYQGILLTLSLLLIAGSIVQISLA